MTEWLLHPQTEAGLMQAAFALPQAFLLSGPEGSGKLFTATEWLGRHLNIPANLIRIVEPDEKTGISVAQVRDLYLATRTKQEDRHFIILNGAHTMSQGAQNAFLKLLEEPNSAFHFILTATTPEALLPTIRSRVQHVAIIPVSATKLIKALTDNFTLGSAAIQQIAFIANGRVGLAFTLASDPPTLEEYRTLATKAKQLLTNQAFERLTLLTPLMTNRTQAMTFLELTAAMASTLLQKAREKEEQKLWTQRISILLETLERLGANANVKVQLTHLALQL